MEENIDFTLGSVFQSVLPIPVKPGIPVTEELKKWYEEALRRRELRLLLAGRLDPSQAKSLQEYILSQSRKELRD